MAERDGSAVDVDPQRVPLQHFTDRDCLRSKGLVDFNQIHIAELPARTLKTAPGRIHRGNPHQRRVNAHAGEGLDSRQHREIKLQRFAFTHHHNSGGTVIYGRGVPRRHRAESFKLRVEFCQPFSAGIGTRLFIGIDRHGFAVLAQSADRNNFIAKTPGINRGAGFLLRAKRIRILQLTANPILARQVFRRHAHMVVIEGIPQSVMNQAVEQLAVTQLCAGAAVGQYVRSAAHVLLPTGNYHVCFATLNSLRRKMQCF